jgi:subtilisin family serine protease
MDIRSPYSNFGATISVCAPSSGAGGWGILTADVTGVSVINGISMPLGYADGDYDFDFGGTSSACPLVAGVCALVLTINPSLTAAEVKSILQQSARKIGAPEDYVQGHSRFFGHGCVDAKGATALAKARLAP